MPGRSREKGWVKLSGYATDKNGISNKYYSLSAAEAEELASKGELGIRGEGLAYVEEVGTDRSKAGYWLIDMIISELMPGDYIVKGRTVN